MITICGHVMCKNCLENNKSVSRCPICSKSFIDNDIVNLLESHSSFSFHNKVESTIYTPAFNC